jgi:hypothetical protein
MGRRVGRQPVFFFLTALVALALYYPTPEEFRWVPMVCAGLGLFWAVLLAIEDLATPAPTKPKPFRADPSGKDPAGEARTAPQAPSHDRGI